MSSKKATKPKKNPAISKAPPPPSSIGGFDPGITSKRPNWSYWNGLPSLSIDECKMLLIDVDPEKPYLDNSKRKRYKRVSRRVQSYQSIGQFPFDHVDINPHKFIRWAESVGEESPKGWQPIKCNFKQNKPKKDSSKWHMYEEAVAACIAMAKAGNSPTQLANELVTYIRSHPDACEQCSKTQSDDTLLRYIRETGDPRDDKRYIEVLSSINSAQKQ